MILVVSSEHDVHATAVLAGLARVGADATLLDLSEFPERMQLSVDYRDGHAPDFRIRRHGRPEVVVGDSRVVWWRRPQPFQVHREVAVPAYRDFAVTEAHEAFAGMWLALHAAWVNAPTLDQAAARKVYQLRVAQEVGLETPATRVTNSPDEARAFVQAFGVGRTIYKAFSATAQHWRETRLVRPEELQLLDCVRFAPTIFQEYVPAQFDLRITIMGPHVFAAAIYSQETSYPVDFRMDMDAGRVEAVELPRDVVDRLHALMGRLGLVYGAVDMRLTPDGRYVFLEVNPSGQWLFVEQRTGQPMTEAFVQLLLAYEHEEDARRGPRAGRA